MSVSKSDSKDLFAAGYYSFIQTAHWVENQLKSALKSHGLTHAQLNVLYILEANNGHPLSAKEIKQQLIVNSPDLTRMLDRLVDKGWVSRKECRSNRRQLDIKLTDKGREAFYHGHHACRKAVNNFFSDTLSASEAKSLRKLMQKIRRQSK